MKDELDKLLCEKYPKMMVNRHKPMTETCMYWGFECGDGWFNILDQLMGNIQHHIDWKNQQKEKFDRGDGCPQVTLEQVKEKFGTLRFYYNGGDEYIRGLVSMAESMSGVTCEGCGAQAETNWPKDENGGLGGWVRTICKPCEEKREEESKKRQEEWEQRSLLKQGFEE
jgi:hypothetical protein